MADAGFFRGTSSDQDGRFSDKEKKLLKLMKFEGLLETKINMRKVNLDVIKPWITVRINEILGVEDDVVIEYIISQLEAKDLNPKIMQINMTGFLNARHARQFMGELWALLNEGQEAEDGVPPSLVEKKMIEMKKEGELNGSSKPAIKTLAQNDWAHRYQNLSLGRFSGTTKEKEVRDDRIVPRTMKSPDRKRSPKETGSRGGSDKRKPYSDRSGNDRGDRGDRGDRRDRGDRGDRGFRGDRGDRGDRGGDRGDRGGDRDGKERQTDKEREIESKRREEERLKRRAAEKERDRKRDEDRDKRRTERRRRSRTRSRSPPRRKFTEDGSDRKKRKRDSSESDSEVETKKQKRKEKKRDNSSEDEKKEKDRKEKKKHKKEKKKKERKRSPTPSSDSDSD